MEQATFSLDWQPDQPSVSQVQRWLTLATATALITYGFSRRSMPGMFLANQSSMAGPIRPVPVLDFAPRRHQA